ncbi:MAG: PAS domain S-box protein, partial [Thermoanaerobaculia bacterium]
MPRPENDALRVAALRSYGILDTEREEEYDSLTELAAIACRAPMAWISLVDENRQWLKSRFGMDLEESTRDEAFCAHAILEAGPLEIRDTLEDPRFRNSRFVTGEPHIRFYVGVPLVTPEGFAIGTLCVADRVPRTLGDEERRRLVTFARHVVRLLELSRREEQYRTIVEGSRDIIYEADPRGFFTFVNSGVTRTLGFTPAELMGRQYMTLIRADWHERVIQHYHDQSLRQELTSYLEFPCVAKDGREVWIGQHVTTNVRNGHVSGFHAVARDVTELILTQRAHRDLQQRFESFMNNSPTLAFIKDGQGRIVFANEQMLREFGKPGVTVIGVRDEELIESLPAIAHETDRVVLESGQTVRVVETLPGSDGVMRHWLVYKFPVSGPDGAAHVGGVAVDVTDRVSLEIDLADARDAAVASARQKSEFLGNMSHEIRTPMNGVMGMLGVLLETPLSEDQREIAETAKFSAESLLSIINDILDYTKIEAGKLTFEMLDFDVRQVAESVVDLLADSARKKSLEI